MSAASGNPPTRADGDGDGDLPTNPVVKKIDPDKDLPKGLVLAGYLGPSRREEFYRLYLGLDFQAYYEIPESGILYIEPVDSSQETRPTRLIIDADKVSKLELVQTLETMFLKGSIVAAVPLGNQPSLAQTTWSIQTYYPGCVPPPPSGNQSYLAQTPWAIQTYYPGCVPPPAATYPATSTMWVIQTYYPGCVPPPAAAYPATSTMWVIQTYYPGCVPPPSG
ncbi:MAG TPA: hypothetical protein VFF52_08490 [Isosphaeraceae bacterium]|nr:hypothetical protein [Isosphaeraceae bacterium]